MLSLLLRRPATLFSQLMPSSTTTSQSRKFQTIGSTLCEPCRKLMHPGCCQCTCVRLSSWYTSWSINQRCRLCQNLRYLRFLYASEGMKADIFELQLCFDTFELHSTYRPSPPTCRTRCVLLIRGHSFGDEEDASTRELRTEWEHRSELQPIFDHVTRKDFPPPPRIVRPLCSKNTRDAPVFNVLQGWINSCLKYHKTCNEVLSSLTRGDRYVPTRLIAVDKKETLRLVDTKHVNCSTECVYATLTHRWSKDVSLRLSRKNKNSLEKKIRILSLPPVFRDAIRVCQSLGIPFLWIDTLCIIQDDDHDRFQEISKMGRIYEHAFLNIGGLAAAEKRDRTSKTGLFLDRTRYAYENDPICARVRRVDYDKLCHIFQPEEKSDLYGSALMKRGWVLQERVLSPRSVYFGNNQLNWECAEHLVSEYFPDGLSREEILRPMPYEWGRTVPFRIKSLILDSRYVADPTNTSEVDVWTSKYQCWMTVFQHFTRCDLTLQTDRLLALSGLAQRFAIEFDDEYLAGLWRKDLFHELLWYRDDDPRELSDIQSIPQQYIAPSWSWASRIFSANFLFNAFSVVFKGFIRTAEVLEAGTAFKDNDPTGLVSDGKIRLKGPMVESNVFRIRWTQPRSAEQYEWYDQGYDKDGYRITGNTYHFLMGYKPWTARMCHPQWNELKVGLILELVSAKDNTYRRVGMFMHPRLEFVSDPEEAHPKCTGFVDFDPENHECTEVDTV